MSSRILVKGASGAGKSTLALELARRLGVPYIELDALHHGPNWSAASAEELQARLRILLNDARGWVVDGNYDSKLGRMLVDRADTIVWLDLALPAKIWRLVRRTARRWTRREELWNGNRESLRTVFWGGDGLFVWAIRSHYHHRRQWPTLFVGRPVVRLRSPQEVAAWLSAFYADARPEFLTSGESH